MNINIIGSGGFEPRPGADSACILINGKYLVDTGWNAVFGLKAHGFDPCELKAIFLTHLHGDHYLGLPGVLFYMGVRRGRFQKEPLPVTIVGPADGLSDFAHRTEQFLQWDRFPELALGLTLKELQGGLTYEDDDLLVRAFALSHTTTLRVPRPIPAIGYRFIEKSSGASCAAAWDTSFEPGIAEAVRGADVLFHDIGHSQPGEAARIAQSAGVGRLLLIHYSGSGEGALADARQVFPRTSLAKEGAHIAIGNDAAADGEPGKTAVPG